MKSRFYIKWKILLVVLFSFTNTVFSIEKLDRGLVALEREDGSVFISWRLLKADEEDISYILSRRCLGDELDSATVLFQNHPLSRLWAMKW